VCETSLAVSSTLSGQPYEAKLLCVQTDLRYNKPGSRRVLKIGSGSCLKMT
jgi:hypothetical protein